jgi:hypothetical protein
MEGVFKRLPSHNPISSKLNMRETGFPNMPWSFHQISALDEGALY